jgi:hypothetical protein
MRTGLYVSYAHERLVGGRLVEPGEIITIDFSGGPQRGDAGPKDSWVIFNERAYVARWRHGEDPGDRFRIMENEKRYEGLGFNAVARPVFSRWSWTCCGSRTCSPAAAR